MTVIGTWNLENLYRPGGEFGPKDEVAYEKKLDELATTITALAPDLLGVQEVGDPEALTDLAGRLGGAWQAVTSDHHDDRGIRVGFLSTRPLEIRADTDTLPDRLHAIQTSDLGPQTHRMGRGALAVRIEGAAARPLDVAVCHLKSKLLTLPGNRFDTDDEGERARYAAYALFRRAAEATAVRALADLLLEGDGHEHQVAVLGDFNDEPSAATTQILQGPPGSEIGTSGFDRPDGHDAARLWNLAPRIPAEQRYSRVYGGHRELIDHIFVSHALLARVEDVHTGTGAAGSDHLPVLARLGH